MCSTGLPSVAAPAALTATMREAGVLASGVVSDVAVISDRPMLVSRIIRLAVSYRGAAADAPETLILKTPMPAFAKTLWRGGRHEVDFYRGLARLMPAGLVPGSYGGAWDEAALTWHLLLEDLTDTHQTATPWPMPPALLHAEGIVRALARLHAAWWDDPRLGVSIGSFTTADERAERARTFAGHYQRFADDMGDRLSADRRAVYERLMAATPRLAERHVSRRNLSILHGDAHVWNFLVPKASGRDDVRAFDFDQWRVGVPANDLAYMLALQLYPERRARIERPLLDIYHRTLAAEGVTGYDRTALDHDYRLAVLWHVAKPVWQWAIQIPPVIWWNNLERIFLAFDDLGCRELLD
ncbi:ecdysteroid 22-kinase family protein [Bradyrhizobium sp. SRS-191]|uniref:ecdysteroid 22-kinase family protein n=1 Tax=Bradyrhizobium sp. SRS-191 TaxID=2962606 RepID=UPI00211EB5C5|nr:ecdysteroid 22-kinase family protein [Bradyrhizobium sp. SRS-191]